MKTVLALCAAALLSVPGFAADSEEAAVARVRALFTRVNAETAKAKPKIKELHDSAEGGEQKTWLAGGAPRKIAVENLGEMGKVLEEYYFDGGELFFHFRKEETYASPGGETVASKETRVYLEKGRAVRCLEGKKKLSEAECAQRAKGALSEAAARVKESAGA